MNLDSFPTTTVIFRIYRFVELYKPRSKENSVSLANVDILSCDWRLEFMQWNVIVLPMLTGSTGISDVCPTWLICLL